MNLRSMMQKTLTEKIRVIKPSGKESDLIQCRIRPRSNNFEVFQESLDVAEGDRVIRILPDNKEEEYRVLEVDFRRIPDPISDKAGVVYTLICEKSNSLRSKHPERISQNFQTYNFNNHISGSHSFQVGNENSQQFFNCLSQLMHEIEASDASPEQKQEAKSTIRKLLENPVIQSVVSGSSGGLSAGLIRALVNQ